MQDLKQSTAAVVSFGPAVDKTDGVTLVTSLVTAIDHATTGIKLSKNGGTLTVRHATVTASTYDSYGNYKVTLDTTDTNTVGHVRMQYVDATTVVPIWADFNVISAEEWEARYGENPSVLRQSTATAGAAGSLTLDASASAVDDYYKYTLIELTSGTGAKQSRMCSGYVGSTKVASVSPNWATTPDNTSKFAILGSGVIGSASPWDEVRASHTTSGTFGEGTPVAPSGIGTTAIATGAIKRAAFAADSGLQAIRSATAQAGSASTLTLDTGASTVDDFYQYQLAYITGGTGLGQSRMITDYVGSTRVATVSPDWATTPDNTSTFAVLPSGVLSIAADGIKRNTPFNDFEFVMYDSTDHLTGKTGLTVTAQRSIDSGLFAACTNAPTEVANGVYVIDFSAADLNGTTITFRFTAAGADPTTITVITVP